MANKDQLILMASVSKQITNVVEENEAGNQGSYKQNGSCKRSSEPERSGEWHSLEHLNKQLKALTGKVRIRQYSCYKIVQHKRICSQIIKN